MAREIGEAFVRGMGSHPDIEANELEQRITDAIARGQRAWPAIAVEPEDFARHLGVLCADGSPFAQPGQQWTELSLEDVYLAWGCQRGDKAALQAFDAEVLAPAVQGRGGVATPGQLEQTVRTKLLVAANGPPKIAEYAGRGRLHSWLRVVVARTRIDLARRRPDHVSPTDEAWSRLEAAADTPELDLIRRTHREEFTAAFAYAVEQLTVRQRNCLRQRLFHGLKNAEIAQAQGVDVRTVKRWMASARDSLHQHTRAWLNEHLAVSGADLDSLVRLIGEGVDLSVGRLLLRDDHHGEVES